MNQGMINNNTAEGSIPNPTKNVSTIATVVTFDLNDHNDHLADFTLLTTTCWIQLQRAFDSYMSYMMDQLQSLTAT